jgi:hypothetical protein
MTARERISYAIRMTISHALYYSGLLHLFLRVKLRDKTVVLAYHRVLTTEQRDRTASHQALVVEDKTFARQVGVLTRLFRVLTLDEFAEHLARRLPFRGPCCLITFDDGWMDNFENALPVCGTQAACGDVPARQSHRPSPALHARSSDASAGAGGRGRPQGAGPS